jgi:hypothetical protein
MCKKIARGVFIELIAASGLLISAVSATMAQSLSGLSCGQLWYERNAIYARYGYCFKTDQAIRAFGKGCFPPFGQLPGGAQARVDDIQGWERRKGC